MNIKIIILAAGMGKRMESDLPKVLAKIKGKSMIRYLLDSVEDSKIDTQPIIVVGYKKDLVIEELGSKYEYVVQEKQLGTGNAVSCAKKSCEDAEHVIILYGDHPFVSKETIKKLLEKHLISGEKVTMATVSLPDFNDWREFFYKNFSRIVRNINGKILKSVEFKDANTEERKITEVNPCYFCFNSKWLWKNLEKIKNNNAQKEYYLTDLVKLAIEDGENIEAISIDPHEGLGANSKKELEILEGFAV